MALQEGQISIHPVVLGELATGNLAKRAQTLAALRTLPRCEVGTSEECLEFIEEHKLHGRGMGWNDVQLLVGARLAGYPLWSLDTRLASAAEELGIAHLTNR
jgi:hypothetical protein